ncbi:MAG TPA: sodium:proton antiporter [Steroidobacteraceae bacterium]|jgi:CPA1 family monovalent cation:H+ antiporter|nr:sodium:proton antiporter [Steroidobacteraceae bacterium]
MALFQIIIALLLVGAVLSLWADRLGIPYPALLALAGVALALIPGTPSVVLDPQLALALFVAPILLDAAYDASPRDLKRNLAAVSSLAVAAVVATILAVAAVIHHLVPAMSWPAAMTLGAIVAPPDASAAVAVLRRLRPPHRMVVILEGESLFNDAGALLAYRVAAAAAMTGVVAGWSVIPLFLLTCGGGVIAGIILARLYLWATQRVRDIPISVLLQFIGTFGVWLLASRLGLSSIITMIAYAMTIARRVPGRVDARRRIASYAVWDVAVFVLNVLAFVLIGLQLRGIRTRVPDSQWHVYLWSAAAVCATVILVRLVWVMGHNRIAHWKLRRSRAHAFRAHGRPMTMPTLGGGLIVSWCGMRGIVTLAAAMALPDGSAATAFPYRDLIVFCAFAVVLVTLVLQGMTLRPLMAWIGLEDDGSVDREVRLARVETARAALKALNGPGDSAALDTLRREYQARMRLGAQEPTDRGSAPDDRSLAEAIRRAVAAQREALLALRAHSVIGDDAFHLAEEEIDLLDLTADQRVRPET